MMYGYENMRVRLFVCVCTYADRKGIGEWQRAASLDSFSVIPYIFYLTFIVKPETYLL